MATILGVPYHSQIKRGRKTFSICPVCGVEFQMVRKDWESHRLSAEAVQHVESHEVAR